MLVSILSGSHTLSWSLIGFSGLSPFLLGSLVPPPIDFEFDLTIDLGSVPFILSRHSSVRSPWLSVCKRDAGGGFVFELPFTGGGGALLSIKYSMSPDDKVLFLSKKTSRFKFPN